MKKYYHGRNKNRPYYGKQIYLTVKYEYAELYGDVEEYVLNFSEEKIFSIKNENHLKLLRSRISEQEYKSLISASGDGELDWAATGYVNTDGFDSVESFLESLGFLGLKLQERTGVESLLIFDQENVTKV